MASKSSCNLYKPFRARVGNLSDSWIMIASVDWDSMGTRDLKRGCWNTARYKGVSKPAHDVGLRMTFRFNTANQMPDETLKKVTPYYTRWSPTHSLDDELDNKMVN